MALQPRLNLRQHQGLQLQPKLLQSIEVLQLGNLALESWLQTAAERNEALLVDTAPSDAPGPAPSSPDRESYLRSLPAPDPTLADNLETQLALSSIQDPTRLAAVRFLIRCVDDAGYLSLSDSRLIELASEEQIDLTAGRLDAAIASLQNLEPRGIGARNAVEALLLQLDPADPEYALLCTLLEDFLEELAKNKLPAVAKALGIPTDELTRLLERLRPLDPRPAAGLGRNSTDPSPAAHPDVLCLRGEDGEFEVALDRKPGAQGLDSVRVDEDLERLARDREQPASLREALRTKVDEARSIVQALEQRRKTLLAVAVRVFHHQRTFLQEGPAKIAPLQMTDVAAELGVHVSTISRTVAGKYAQTPFGVFPLRQFFQSAAGGAPTSGRDSLKQAVTDLFAGEDRSKPLSDDEAAEALRSQGFDVARRTIANFRKELEIPSSYRRRRFD